MTRRKRKESLGQMYLRTLREVATYRGISEDMLIAWAKNEGAYAPEELTFRHLSGLTRSLLRSETAAREFRFRFGAESIDSRIQAVVDQYADVSSGRFQA